MMIMTKEEEEKENMAFNHENVYVYVCEYA